MKITSKIVEVSALWNWTVGDVVSVHNSSEMDTMISVWTMVEHVRVASGAAELAIFTAILYWFFTSRSVHALYVHIATFNHRKYLRTIILLFHYFITVTRYR